MFLQRLREYGQRVKLPPPGYGPIPIRWAIVLDAGGQMEGFVDLRTAEKGRGARGSEFMVPDLKRGTKIAARLLADNGEYVLGIDKPDADPALVAKRHEAFVQLVRECWEATAEPAVQAVLTFLEGLPGSLNASPSALDSAGRGLKPDDFDASANVLFETGGQFVTDLPAVREFWARRSTGGDDEDAQRVLPCIVCGRDRPAVERLPVNIKGTLIPGGQTSGMTLISANETAYESYGLKASHVAPICHECAEVTHRAANILLSGEAGNIFRTDDLVYAAWTPEETDFDPLALLDQPEPGQVVELLRSAYKANPTALHLDSTRFYAVALAASGARVVVKEWIDTTVAQARANLARFFRLQRLVGADGQVGAALGLYALASATVRTIPAERPKPPSRVVTALLRLALSGSPLPPWVLHQAVQRARIDGVATRPRAALIKMALAQQLGEGEGDSLMSLDTTRPEPAYQCGRLLAVLEEIQEAALGGVNATVVDRHFGTACTAPAVGFPGLLRLAQTHLGKMRRDDSRQGAYRALQGRMGEVMERIGGFPAVLDLTGQGLFSLGYWHQRAASVAARTKAARQKQEAATEGAVG